MSDSTPLRVDENEEKLIFPIVYFFVGTFIVLDLLSAFEPTAWNWGFHFLAFYGLEVRFAVPFLMLIVMIPPVQFFLVDLIRSVVGLTNVRSRVLRWGLGVVALVGIALIFVHFRVVTYFLGDGYLQLRSLKVPENMDTLNLTGFAREPLVGFFVFQLRRLFDFLGSSTPPEEAYLWLSVLSGVCFALIAWRGSGLFVVDETDRILIFIFFFASGVSLLFFGYVENYAPGYVGIFLFLLLGAGYLKEKIPMYWAMGAYGFLLSMNFGAAAFIPTLAYLVYVGVERRETVKTGAALLLSIVVFVAMLLISGYSPSFFQQVVGEAGVNILPFAGPTGSHQAYHMFSLNHLADVMNLFLLCAPASVALLTVAIVATIRKRKRLETYQWFILLAMACGVGLIAVLNCALGMSRDWDVAAPFSVGIPVAAIVLWTAVAEDREIRQRVMLILGVVTLLQTGAWIGLNADEQRAVARFEVLEEKELWGTQACLDAYEELAIYHRGRHELAQAAACYERYLALDSTNYRVWFNCARTEQAAGNLDRAIEAYKVLARSGPASPDILAPLAVLLARLGRFDEALLYFRQAETLAPESPKIKNDIGALFANQKNYSKALPYFLEAIRIDPQFQGGYLNAAACYEALGDNEKVQEIRMKAKR